MIKPKLKLVEEKEFEDFHRLINRNKERLKRYFPITVKKNESISSTIDYLNELTKKSKNKEIYAFGIYFKNLLIGLIFIKNIDWRIPKCELGYFIDHEYEGRGIITEMVDKTIHYCFENLKMEKVFLKIGSDNLKSKGVAKKLGFLLEGILHNEFRTETNDLIHVEYYGKLNTINKNR